MNNTDKSLSIISKVRSYHHHNRNPQVLISRNAQVRTILTITVVLSIVVIYQGGVLTDADALTRYYNCTTRAANKNGTLSLHSVDNCYDFIFKGAKAAEKELQVLKLEQTTTK
jgi:hypothetical protein